MGLMALLRTAREKQKQANTLEAKTARAQEKVRRARTRAQLEKARADLQIARMEQQKASMSAQIALERAKAEVERAKTAKLHASDELWKARYRRARTVAAPLTGAGRLAGKGLAATAGYIWGKPASGRRRKKRIATRRRS